MNEAQTHHPVRHLVYLSVKREDDNAKIIQKGLRELANQLPDVIGFYFDACNLGEPYTHFFFIDFKNKTARDNYLSDPRHAKVAGETIVPRLSGDLKSSVLVFDYEKHEKITEVKTYKHQPDIATAFVLISEQEQSEVESLYRDMKKFVSTVKIKTNCSTEGLSHGYNTLVKAKLNGRCCLPEEIRHRNLLFFISHHQQEGKSLEEASKNVLSSTLSI